LRKCPFYRSFLNNPSHPICPTLTISPFYRAFKPDSSGFGY